MFLLTMLSKLLLREKRFFTNFKNILRFNVYLNHITLLFLILFLSEYILSSLNIRKIFLNLIKTRFPRNNNFHKIFNRNTIKISYGCMRNISLIFVSHDKSILRRKAKTMVVIVEIKNPVPYLICAKTKGNL